MTSRRRTSRARISGLMVGLSVVGLAVVWSSAHPPRAALIVEGGAFLAGNPPTNSYLRHSWAVRNVGPARIKLRTRFTHGHSGFSLWQGQDHFLEPGESIVVSLTCPTPDHPGVPFSEYATVLTGDPRLPRVRFRIYGITARRSR